MLFRDVAKLLFACRGSIGEILAAETPRPSSGPRNLAELGELSAEDFSRWVVARKLACVAIGKLRQAAEKAAAAEATTTDDASVEQLANVLVAAYIPASNSGGVSPSQGAGDQLGAGAGA